MAKFAKSPPEIGLVDDPTAPEIFADGAAGFFLFAGNLRITLEELRAHQDGVIKSRSRVVTGRLIMPLDGSERLAHTLLQFVAEQRNKQATEAQAAATVQ